MRQIQRRRLGLSVPAWIADTWSSLLQISRQTEAFEFPRRNLPKQVRFVGPLQPPGGYPPVPFPWDRLDGRPLIYASLGTIANRVAGTFRMIAEACDGLDAQLVISTGRGVSPDVLGDLPGRPLVVHYAPQAARLVWTGAGETIPLRQATSQRLRTLVTRALSNPSYRAAAERVRDSFQAAGGAPRAAKMIEQDLSLGHAPGLGPSS